MGLAFAYSYGLYLNISPKKWPKTSYLWMDKISLAPDVIYYQNNAISQWKGKILSDANNFSSEFEKFL